MPIILSGGKDKLVVEIHYWAIADWEIITCKAWALCNLGLYPNLQIKRIWQILKSWKGEK